MSFKTFLVEVEEGAEHLFQQAISAAQVTAAKVEAVAIGEVHKAEALAMQSGVGVRAMNLVSDLENSTLSGADRMSKLLDDVRDDYQAFLSAGGFKGLLASGEAAVKSFGASAYAAFRAAVSGSADKAAL